MILSVDSNPKYSLYYIGALIINILKQKEEGYLDEIIKNILLEYKNDIPINYIYYGFDWLYLLSIIDIKEDKVILCR